MGVGVFVTVTVPEDKKDEFLKVMEVDVVESRKEEGCLRFDLGDLARPHHGPSPRQAQLSLCVS